MENAFFKPSVIEKTKRISVDLEEIITDELKKRAKADDRSMNKYLKRVLTQIALQGYYCPDGKEMVFTSHTADISQKNKLEESSIIEDTEVEDVNIDKESSQSITLDVLSKPKKKISKI